MTVDSIQVQARRLAGIPVQELFARDPDRFKHFSREMDGLLLDFSRQRIDEEALTALFERAGAPGCMARIDGLFEGEQVNNTEKRAALHTLLRAPAGSRLRPR